MRTLLVTGALLITSCHHGAGGGGGYGSDVDSLWALAPDGTRWGVVATPRAIGYANRIVDHLRVLADDPELALLHRLVDPANQLLGGPTRHLADLGVSADRGTAVFATQDGVLIVLPVGNRDKLLAALHGERGNAVDHLGDLPCKPIKDVYACASNLAMFDRIGKGKLRGRAEVAGARGDLEAFAAAGAFGGSLGDGFLTATIDDGELSIHGFVAGSSPAVAALAGRPRPHIEADRAAGFLAIDLAPVLSSLPTLNLPGRDGGKLVQSIRGPVVATMGAATNDLDVHIPLADTGPFESLVNHCGDLAALLPITAKASAGACHISITTPIALDFEVWVENKELRVATHKASHPLQKAFAMSAVGKELAADDWTYTAWGHGSLLAPGLRIPARPDEPGYNLVLRLIAQINEAGVGVKIGSDGVHLRAYLRTIWTNPLAIAAKLAGVSALEITSGRAAATGQNLANNSPGTPFADDFGAGQAGMLAPIGLVAAVVAPALSDYMKKSKKPEATLQLDRLARSLKVYYNENSAFPVAEVPLSPAVSCCEENYQNTHHCSPSPDTWRDPLWHVLDFSIDEPHLYQYSYRSDGATFIATAVGDLDCDTTMITYTLTGSVRDGRVETTLAEPPPGAD